MKDLRLLAHGGKTPSGPTSAWPSVDFELALGRHWAADFALTLAKLWAGSGTMLDQLLTSLEPALDQLQIADG